MYKVYLYTNLLDGKKYCGMIKRSLEERAGKNGIHYQESTRFYKAILKYGFENFSKEILFDNLTKEEAEQKEIETIKKYDLTNKENGYNIHFWRKKSKSDRLFKKRQAKWNV